MSRNGPDANRLSATLAADIAFESFCPNL